MPTFSYHLLTLPTENGSVMETSTVEDGMDLVGNATIDKTGRPGRANTFVGLRGEFDVCDLQPLRDVLDDALRTGTMIDVDLSRVAFLDARCARELAVRSLRRGDRLTLRNPSWQARASLEVCGAGGVIVPARARAYDESQEARNHAWKGSPGLAELAV